MNKKTFIKEVKLLGIAVTDKELEQLDEFYHILLEENKHINLTRIIDEEAVYLKHFYDSLTIVKAINLSKIQSLCDVGSGAGFPGIVLKIFFPNLRITLIDSLQKRVNYLNQTIEKLGLKNIQAVHARAENYNSEKFDIVTSRAVANIEKLITYTMHLLKKEGIFIAMKADIDKELTTDVEQQINKNYQIIKINKFLLPIENSKRALVLLKNKN